MMAATRLLRGLRREEIGAEPVALPQPADTPEGRLFNVLQAIFNAYDAPKLPTPRERDNLRRAGLAAVEGYFVEKLADRASVAPKSSPRAGTETE